MNSSDWEAMYGNEVGTNTSKKKKKQYLTPIKTKAQVNYTELPRKGVYLP